MGHVSGVMSWLMHMQAGKTGWDKVIRASVLLILVAYAECEKKLPPINIMSYYYSLTITLIY